MHKPRNLTATVESTSYQVERHERLASGAIRKALEEPDNPHQYSLLEVPSHLARGLLQRYARGDSPDLLRRHFHGDYLPLLQQAADLSAKLFPDHRLRLHADQTASWMLLFALVCFDDEGAHVAHLDNWFTPDGNPVLFAMVRKAFAPGERYPADLDIEHKAMPHEEQLVGALLQPPATWPHAFAAYMKQWPRLMKDYGYREQVEEGKSAFDYFPLHLGLAVCAFDVDDSAFRHLPYYPHELVDHYRAHVRLARDAWRSCVLDPGEGLPDTAKPKPRKDYVLSKAEAYARWIELVCGEQPVLIDAARQALGKRKTMPPIDRLTETLAPRGLALHADLKDDAALATQATALCKVWQLPATAFANTAQQGAAAATTMLNALQDCADVNARRLAVFDGGGDNWNALLYSYHHEAEFTTLCEQLGLKRLDRSQWQ
ncbi:PoNe immunity protein domain-containing protein [Pseudoduganella violaceinigra]|uniref:PoNe immunity protein domain-containing protein n=1 Tax=Pseudoduganella violaceinigra TaxID=246602 RepID=UPI00041EF1F8|nr:PoNe immunity protein domain-containing protein [Pseudoduganella violaceinigra]